MIEQDVKKELEILLKQSLKEYLDKNEFLAKLQSDGVLNGMGMEWNKEEGHRLDYDSLEFEFFGFQEIDTEQIGKSYECHQFNWGLPNTIIYREGIILKSSDHLTYFRGTVQNLVFNLSFNPEDGSKIIKIVDLELSLDYQVKYYGR